jgi:hypothetical protein
MSTKFRNEQLEDSIEGKTIDGDNNTISNLAHGAEVDNPSSGVHGVSGDVMGTTDTQTVENKTTKTVYLPSDYKDANFINYFKELGISSGGNPTVLSLTPISQYEPVFVEMLMCARSKIGAHEYTAKWYITFSGFKDRANSTKIAEYNPSGENAPTLTLHIDNTTYFRIDVVNNESDDMYFSLLFNVLNCKEWTGGDVLS